MNKEYLRRKEENELDYAMRLISLKKETKPDDLDWCDICELLDLDYNPDSLRKAQDSQFGGLAVYKQMLERLADNSDTDLKEDLKTLKKLKLAIAEERASLAREYRQQNRVESLREIAIECVGKMPPLEKHVEIKNLTDYKTMIITLSDFHYGLEINEFNNIYDSNVFHSRFEHLLCEIITHITANDINHLVVLGIGDFISGIIHNVLRIEAREDVISQVISVSEALISFLNNLADYAKIDYYDCVGNHSRLFEDKNNCLAKESFDLLIHYILEQRFINDKNININNFTINEKIGEFELYGKKYAFTHGDNFNIDTLAKDLSQMTKQFYEAIFIGHIHHLYFEEQNGTLVASNGSFAGNDEYSNKLRKTSNPSQNIFIVNKDGINTIIPIKL
ncbi:MAG: metallophosphoesterase family protein [Methanobrevibacter sp.]|nr:metallophosphoesterase family protein [Methanobrevibacter sp.]